MPQEDRDMRVTEAAGDMKGDSDGPDCCAATMPTLHQRALEEYGN